MKDKSKEDLELEARHLQRFDAAGMKLYMVGSDGREIEIQSLADADPNKAVTCRGDAWNRNAQGTIQVNIPDDFHPADLITAQPPAPKKRMTAREAAAVAMEKWKK